MAAINDTQHNLLVIKASAGSGKTYNLALQYIAHLLFTHNKAGNLVPRRQPDATGGALNAHRLLLAITFTNKATDEMKSRIVKELRQLAVDPASSGFWTNEFSDPAKYRFEKPITAAQMQVLAQRALRELLFDYSNFNVSTIDSFFQSILRSFARELDRDFNYDIQLKEGYAIGMAVHNFLLSLGKRRGVDTQVEQWVKTFQQQMITEDKGKKGTYADLSSSLNKFARVITREEFRSRMDDVRSYLGTTDETGTDFSRIRQFQKVVNAACKAYADKLEPALDAVKHIVESRDLKEHLAGNRSLKNLWKDDILSKLPPSLVMADEEKVRAQFKKSATGANLDAAAPQLVEALNALYEASDIVEFLSKVEATVWQLGLLGMIDRYLTEYRHQTNSILLGDTGEMISTVLKSGVPFVYERVGTTIKHFMIDEFQDTSAKQYENFKELILESLANGNFNMLIGDAKQSIYRFRNADITVFRDQVGKDFKDHILNHPLEVNYRSSPTIIHFNNNLFKHIIAHWSGNEKLRATYQEVEQQVPEPCHKVPGYVRILTTDFTGQPFKKQLLDKVCEMLPTYLLDLHKRFEWREMGILVNARSDGAAIVKRLLEHNKGVDPSLQIPVSSSESLLLANSPIVCRLVTMLRFIDAAQLGTTDDDDPDDATRGAMKAGKKRRINDQRFFNVLNQFIKQCNEADDADETGRLLARCFEQYGQENTGDSGVEHLLPDSHQELMTLMSMTENLIAQVVTEGQDSGDVPFLQAFQDCVMQFCSQRNGGSVREFLRYWDEESGTLTISASAGNDAINIMTIHKAKGLEFPCVIIPVADWEIEGIKDRECWMPRELFVDVLNGLQPSGSEPVSADVIPPLVALDIKATLALEARHLLNAGANEFIDKRRNDEFIDNLNKTYVALTRPNTEMHIFTFRPDSKQGHDEQVSDLLCDFIDHGGMMIPIAPDECSLYTGDPGEEGAEGKTGWYHVGEMSSWKQLHPAVDKADDEQPSTPMTEYAARPIPANLAVRVDNASSPYIDAGLRLHSIMQRITDRDDWPSALEYAVRRHVVSTDPDDLCNDGTMTCLREGLFQVPLIAQWFDPANRVLTERTIIACREHDDHIERPDRVVITPDGRATVIDYKSGVPRKRDLQQVREYEGLLREAGYTVAGAYVWYVNQRLVIADDGSVAWQASAK